MSTVILALTVVNFKTRFFYFPAKVILLILTIEDAGNMSYFSKLFLAAGVPFQMFTSLVGWIAMRTEQLLLVWCFLPLCCAEPVFIAYRISQVWEKEKTMLFVWGLLGEGGWIGVLKSANIFVLFFKLRIRSVCSIDLSGKYVTTNTVFNLGPS